VRQTFPAKDEQQLSEKDRACPVHKTERKKFWTMAQTHSFSTFCSADLWLGSRYPARGYISQTTEIWEAIWFSCDQRIIFVNSESGSSSHSIFHCLSFWICLLDAYTQGPWSHWMKTIELASPQITKWLHGAEPLPQLLVGILWCECISYLLLCNRLPQNSVAKNTHSSSHNFSESGI
jgi:hypothetical protein